MEPDIKQPEQPEAAGPPDHLQRTVWSPQTRRLVLIGLVIVAAFVLYWIRGTLTELVLALLIAYLLNPLVVTLQRHLGLSRLLATGLIYLGFVVLLIATFVTVIPMLVRQVSALIGDLDSILGKLDDALSRLPFLDALGIRVDSITIAEQLRTEIGALAALAPGVLIGALSGAFAMVVVLVLSFYLLKDAEWIGHSIDQAVPTEYHDEWNRIKTELANIWSNFLRGQVLLALIIGAVTTIVLSLLGVRNALLLGLVAGILEVVPNLGPIIAAIPAVLIAFFQGSANWAIENTTFAIIVIVAYVLIQQLENHLIVPNVLGSSVDLPPVVILFGALAGASLAGVLGIFLAAPVLATARLVLAFIIRKLLEPAPTNKPATD